jgi:hypothetical protein
MEAELHLAGRMMRGEVESWNGLLGGRPQRPCGRRPLAWGGRRGPERRLLGAEETESGWGGGPDREAAADGYQQRQEEGKEVTPPAMTTSVVPALPWLDVG